MSSIAFDDAALLAALGDNPHRPLHIAEVLEHLGLSSSLRRIVSASLDDLVARGLVSAMPGSRYRLVKGPAPTVEGHYTQHPRGFGFVAAIDGEGDVFIPPTGVLGAMHGDLVACTAQASAKGREGIIVEVITRRSDKVPGVLRVRQTGSWVEPDDARIRGPISLDTPFAALDGQSVVCEITRFPVHAGETPVGRVVEVLGRSGELETEVRKVLIREGVVDDYDAEAVAEAAAYGERVTEAEREGREDLRGLALVTIDPDDARDHDDAVHVLRREDGSWQITVAIADVAHYVRPGTALDREALTRGLSIYLPDRAIAMLPRALSSHLASLIEAQDRLVMAVIAELDPMGEILSTRVVEGVICSRARLTYTMVARALGWTDAPAAEVPAALLPMLRDAADIAGILRGRRQRRGALDFDLPEGRVKFDAENKPVDVVQSRRDPGIRRAYSLIEEMMLLGNEAVARLAVERDLPTVFRVHGEPDEEHLEKISVVARAYGHNLDPEEARKPRKLSAFLRKLQGKPESRVISMLALRAMQQARYSPHNTGHFGLASEAYLHFTSPIRRYPDVVVHRGVKALLRDGKAPSGEKAKAANARAAAEVSRLERRAMEVEREVLDLYRCAVAEKHIGTVFTGTITGLSANGLWVEIDAPFLTGSLKAEALGADTWEIDELGIRMRGARTGRQFTLGDTLAVELKEVSLEKRLIGFELTRDAREVIDARSLKRKHREAEKANKREKRKGPVKKGARGRR
ncbi:MAG: ribonuclease R [Myxococcales bacterium]|nr:ribonuclease R [Myxococcales bacterium]